MKRATVLIVSLVLLLVLATPAEAKGKKAANTCEPKPSQEVSEAGQLNNDALKLISDGKLAEAIAKFEAAEKLAPDFADLFYNHAIALYRLEKYEDALKLIEASTGKKDKWGEMFYLKGETQMALKQFDAAIQSYTRAIELTPELAAAHVGIARAYEAKGDMDKAIETLEHAVLLFPGHREINWVLGTLYLATKNPQAVAAFSRIQATDPSVPGLCDMLAMSWYLLDVPNEATKMAEKALKKNPEAINSNFIMATMHVSAKEWDKALPFVDMLIKLKADDFETQLMTLEVYVFAKKVEKMDILLNSMLKAYGNDPEKLLRIAIVLKRAEHDQADPLLKQVHQLYKDNGDKEGQKKVKSLM